MRAAGLRSSRLGFCTVGVKARVPFEAGKSIDCSSVAKSSDDESQVVSAHFQRWQRDSVKRAAVQRANEEVPVPGRVAHNELTMPDLGGAADLGEWMTWAYSHPEKASDFPGHDRGSSVGKRR